MPLANLALWFDAMKRLRFSRLSLRTQIASVFGVLAVALSAVLSVALGELLKLNAQRSAGATLLAAATNVSKTLSDGLHERSREAEMLAASSNVWAQGLDSGAVKDLLASSQAVHGHNSWIGVVDSAGLVKAATGNLLVGQNVAARPWFRGALEQSYVGDVHPAVLLANLLQPGRGDGEPLRFLDFAAPIRQSGAVVGVLCIHVSWDWAREVVENLLPPLAHEQDIQAFVFDRQGQLIYASDMAAMGRQRLPAEAPLGDTTQRRDIPPAMVLRWDDGHDYLSAVVNVQARSLASDLGWRVVVRQLADTAFAEARSAERVAFALGVPVAVLAAVLGWAAAHRLSRDLVQLADAAREVEQVGQGSALPRLDSNHEVWLLSAALRRMTSRLLSLNESMETQVRQRTRELELANQELDRQARTDALTGLLNRRGLDAQLRQSLAMARRAGRPLSVLLMDLDHFKRINDTFGHDVGDEVLKLLARTLLRRLRDSDICARSGGEEFVALLPDTDLDGARVIAEALVQAMAQQTDAVWGRVTISVGVATLRPTDSEVKLLRRADEALYEAKGGGRNRVCVEDPEVV